MKPGLQVGHAFELMITVQESMRPQFGEHVIHSVYSTAAMLNHMEWAARQHVLPYLEPHEESVGYHIDLTHCAPAPLGVNVLVRSTVVRVGRVKVVSQVEAFWGKKQLGKGLLTQAIVPKTALHFVEAANAAFDVSALSTSSVSMAHSGAVIQSANGRDCFSTAVLGWETTQPGCTRYDEWLVARLGLSVGLDAFTYEGPCLLHYELEALIDQIGQVLNGAQRGYQSEFLESCLKLGLEAQANGFYCFSVCLSPNQPVQGPKQVEFVVDKESLTCWLNQLVQQWEQFPSRL